LHLGNSAPAGEGSEATLCGFAGKLPSKAQFLCRLRSFCAV
jgi:hypothetical protein